MKTSTTLYASFEELCLCSPLEEAQILELIEQEIITPESGQRRTEWQFSVTAINTLKRAARIQSELMVDWEDLPLVLSLLGEIDRLKAENAQLAQLLNRFLTEESE